MRQRTATDYAYLKIEALRKMTTEEIRQIQLEVGSLLDDQILMPSCYKEEYNRLLGKCAKVLSERHKATQLLLF